MIEKYSLQKGLEGSSGVFNQENTFQLKMKTVDASDLREIQQNYAY